MDRSQKSNAVAALKENLAEATSVVVCHYRGLTVEEITDLRAKARANGATIKVTKNTLAKIAANDTPFQELSESFAGPTALAISDDAVAAAKTVVEFAKNNEKLIIVSGAVDGKILDESGVKTLASTPSLDESRAKLVGLLQAPASALVGLLQAPGGQVARVISARGEQAE
jgi:large subunit ribosomal protein L10